MHKFISPSDNLCSFLAIVLCTYCLLSGCNMKAHTEALAAKEGYLITIGDEATEKDTRWAKYLYDHLRKRSNDEEIVAFGVTEKDMWRIIIQVDPTQQEAFKITRKGADIQLITPDDKRMLWLQYQLMKIISREDPRIDGSELPPAIIQLNDTCGSFAFEYQSIYSPTGLDADYTGIAGLSNFDDSWGIWGHNLRKVLGGTAEKLYATVDGKKNAAQLCFSAEEMYRSLEGYIVDNYGEKGDFRFVIAPDDSPLTCTCPACKKAGNTPKTATPAVTGLITRLARRFPELSFFTTSYLSTQKVPEQPLPKNVGVIISAMDYPLVLTDGHSNAGEKNFAQQLEQWKKITGTLYIWDYINNFDDYLTPFPVLNILRERLQFYKQQGVSGVFFNGSGYDYSSLDEMRTFVLSSLLINPELPVHELVKAYLYQEYPVSKNWLYDYYTGLESGLLPGKELSLYAGIRELEKVFLRPEEFCKFYDEMESFVTQAKGRERKRLHQLQTALSFTRLEIARNHAASAYGYAKSEGKSIHPIPQVKEWMTRLGEYKSFPKMACINESDDEIGHYLKEWNDCILSANLSGNLFAGILSSCSQYDGNPADLFSLTDGTPGLASSYHFGWAILPKDEVTIDFPVENLQVAGTLHVSFLHFPRHRFYAPTKIELLKDGVVSKSVNIAQQHSGEKSEIVKVNIPADLRGAKVMSLKITCPKAERAQIAIDEIALIR